MTTDQKIDEILGIVLEERKLNNDRFTQLATGLKDVKQEVGSLRNDLNAKIDHIRDSLSQDIQIFAEDLYQVKRRVTRLEKKLPS